MFKLRYGYLLSGIITGCILLTIFVSSFPDGKLHIIFCNVGQGDAAYVRFPDGRDMLIDGGPDDSVLTCLGRHMPFWDRNINVVINTHPQNDHLKGLVSVLHRYTVDYVVRSDLVASSDVYAQFVDAIKQHHIQVRFLSRGQRIMVGATSLLALWPTRQQVARMQPAGGAVLGAASDTNLNDGSLVLALRYGTFDALFPGDADSHVEPEYASNPLADGALEVLKVPHHGSKTGMTQAFVAWAHPAVSVISVGKNSYGHPSKEAIDMLQNIGSVIHRTDREDDIEIVSDGKTWQMKTGH